MLLAIDIGNSTVGFGFFDGDRLALKFRAETRIRTTPDEYISFLVGNMERAGIGPGDVEGTVMSSVVPPLVPTLFEVMRGVCPSSPLVVSPRLKLGIRITYKTPESLGVDRIVCAAAAYMMYGGPCTVVDFGTATTFTFVDHDGNLTGGAIVPGLHTSSEALTGSAFGLPRMPLTHPKSAIGTTTDESLLSGIIYGHAAMVDGILGRFKEELGAAPVTIATGGSAAYVTPHTRSIDHKEPDLCFKGLKAIYEKNK